jgi:phosphomannomutase/phosphoglucomutase
MKINSFDKFRVDPSIFRAYDIRGIYPKQLNDTVAWRTAKAIAEFYPNAQKLVVACDSRLSSPSLSQAVINGLLESGKEVIDIGIAPDPLFYFTIFHHNYDGGIMISGSHNPKEYNGMTLNIRKAAKDKPKDIIQEELEKIKEKVLEKRGFGRSAKRGSVKKFDPTDDYINYVTSRINLKRRLKIIIDSANGACGYLPEKVFKKLDCKVKTLYGDFDGTFPNHPPDPYKEENLKDIKEKVLEEKADIGFAFDTDGDRVAPIDNKGRQILGDACLLMLARQVLKKKKGPIVHCMRVSKALLDEMAKQGVRTYFSVSHHSAIIKKIIEVGAVFGGEITYHLFFPLNYYLYDDALFASLKLAEIVSQYENFSQYIDNLPSYQASPEVFIEFPDEKKFKVIEHLQEYLRKNNYDFIDIDGARINFHKGWALIRASNTEPALKCRFEGETKKSLKEIEKKSLEIFQKAGILITKKIYQELSLEE